MIYRSECWIAFNVGSAAYWAADVSCFLEPHARLTLTEPPATRSPQNSVTGCFCFPAVELVDVPTLRWWIEHLQGDTAGGRPRRDGEIRKAFWDVEQVLVP